MASVSCLWHMCHVRASPNIRFDSFVCQPISVCYKLCARSYKTCHILFFSLSLPLPSMPLHTQPEQERHISMSINFRNSSHVIKKLAHWRNNWYPCSLPCFSHTHRDFAPRSHTSFVSSFVLSKPYRFESISISSSLVNWTVKCICQWACIKSSSGEE